MHTYEAWSKEEIEEFFEATQPDVWQTDMRIDPESLRIIYILRWIKYDKRNLTVNNTKLPETNRKLTPDEFNLMKEIRKQTEASYRDIIAGIKIHGLDKEAVIDYLREICVVSA